MSLNSKMVSIPLKSDGIAKKKSKQPSRKGKKTWRKNVDIMDIEENLDQLRTEDITGGRLHAQKDEEIFTIDKRGDDAIKKTYKLKPLKVDEILSPNSSLPAIKSRNTTVSSVVMIPGTSKKISKNHLKLLNKKAAEELEKHKGHVDLQEIERRKKEETKKKILEKNRRKAGNAFIDLWGKEEATPIDEYLEPAMIKPVKKPKTPKVRVEIPAVSIGHPGTSYNPSFTAHQDVLKLAVDEVMEKINKSKELQKKLSYPKHLDKLREDDEVDGEEDIEEISIEDNHLTGDDGLIHINQPVTSEDRKTTAQRNREARIKKQLENEKRKKRERKLKQQFNELPKLAKEVAKESRAQQEKAKSSKEAPEPIPKRLGPHLFKPPAMTVQLTEELTDSLRRLKPEGHIIKDRFASLQARALIEPRVPVKKRQKYRTKTVESHDYKRFK